MSPRRDLVWLAALGGVTLALYARGLQGGYFGDDFQFVTWPPRVDVASALLERNPQTGWWRPLEALVLQSVQARAGLATWPIHLIAIATHTLLAWVTLRAVRRLGGDTRAAVIAGFACAGSQGAAMAVGSNDTVSFLFGTLGGAVAAYALLPRAPVTVAHDGPASAAPAAPPDASAPIGIGALVACGTAYALALLGKETSVGWLPLLLAVLAWRAWRGPRRRPVLAAVALVALTAGYMAFRAHTGATPPSFGPGRYQLGLGFNMVENIGLLGGALLSPVAPEMLFRPEPLALPRLAAVGGVLMVAMLTLYALRVPRLRGRVIGAVIGGACVLSPVLPLNRVSELYGYAGLPFLAIAIGLALGRALSGRFRVAWGLAALALAVGHLIAVEYKLGLLVANGDRAAALLGRLRPHVASVAPGGTLWLVSHEDPGGRYSVFRMPGFHVLDYSDDFLRAWYARPDLKVALRDEPGSAPEPRAGDVVVRWSSADFAAALDRGRGARP